DVKTGNGAFADTFQMADELARSIVDVANGAGVRTHALITDMNQVLGHTAGNAVEIRETLAYLENRYICPRLHEVTLSLAAEMLVAGGLTEDLDDARTRAETALTSGQARDVFARMVSALGGPNDFCEKPEDYLESAPVVMDIPAPADGVLTRMQTRDIGLAVVALGGGRTRPQDSIDHAVGFDRIRPLGSRVSAGETIARVHARTEDDARRAIEAYQNAIELGDHYDASPVILKRLTGEVSK
ncbi:MAG: thymidine phosphorylase, partial [Gammaproteobacteria bacterium]